jgi:hypothetical protein
MRPDTRRAGSFTTLRGNLACSQGPRRHRGAAYAAYHGYDRKATNTPLRTEEDRWVAWGGSNAVSKGWWAMLPRGSSEAGSFPKN